MPKKKKEHLLPREPITRANETLAEAESRSDRRFASEFEAIEMEKGWTELLRITADRGWIYKDGEFSRKGVPLGADAAFAQDSTCYAALHAYDLRQQLRKFVKTSSWEQIRAIRIACESGAAHTEFLEAKRREGAPKKMMPEIVAEAVERFRTTPGNTYNAPTFDKVKKPPYWQHENPLTRQHFTKWKNWDKAHKSKRAG